MGERVRQRQVAQPDEHFHGVEQSGVDGDPLGDSGAGAAANATDAAAARGGAGGDAGVDAVPGAAVGGASDSLVDGRHLDVEFVIFNFEIRDFLRR